jgi:deazaflavin-dependent oxidoreductase (nitroreductase family)
MGHKRALLMGVSAGAFVGLLLGRQAGRTGRESRPGPLWRGMRWLNPRVAGAYRPDGPNSGLVLVLTTTGRKSGRPHVTPLQYEMVDDAYYVASARGRSADWFRNIEVNPQVTVEAKAGRFTALAEPITEPERIAGYLEMRRRRHPAMIKAMLLMHGLPPRSDRDDLLRLGQKLALVILRPSTSPLAEPAVTA